VLFTLIPSPLLLTFFLGTIIGTHVDEQQRIVVFCNNFERFLVTEGSCSVIPHSKELFYKFLCSKTNTRVANQKTSRDQQVTSVVCILFQSVCNQEFFYQKKKKKIL